ncbi:MAG: AI-2E family transporter [Actinomycetota bacterium]
MGGKFINHRVLTDRTVERLRDIAIVSWATIGVFLILYGLARILGEISLVLRPFIFALLIVFILKPLLAFLEERGLPRSLALVLTYLFFFAILIVILFFLVPVIVSEVNAFVKAFPSLARAAERAIRGYQARYQTVRIPPQATKMLDSALSGLQDSTIRFLSNLPGFTVSLLSLILDFVLAPLIAFFILIDRDRIGQAIISLIPKSLKDEGLYLARRLNTAIEGYLRIMLLLAVIVGIFSSIGLSVMGIPYAVLLGFFAGFVQIIPYLGPILAIIPPALIALFTKSTWFAVAVIIYLTVLTQVGSLVLAPVLLRQHVGLHPVWVIFALLLGGALFGFWGVVLAIPVAAVIYEIASFLLLSPEERKIRMREA